MFAERKQKRIARERIWEERQQLLRGVDLAMEQWRYVTTHLDEGSRKYDVIEIMERRYMFLLNTAKKQKLHALF